MTPADALADLTEISAQIEAAVLAGPDGSLVASTLPDEARAGEIAATAVRLLSGAEDGGGRSRLTHVRAASREGCVFVARDERHVVAAVTGAEPTVGLVFYDLKVCLRSLDEEPAAPPRKRRKAKKADA